MKQLYTFITQRIYIKIILLCIVNAGFSSKANAKIDFQDSLYRVVTDPNTPLNKKYEYYNYLCNYTRTADYFDNSKKYSLEYLHLAKKENNELEQAKAYSHLALLYNNRSIYDTSLYYINQVKSIALKTNNVTAKIYLAEDLSEQYFSFLEYEKIIAVCLKTLPLFTQSNDYSIQPRIYYSLYSVYKEWNNAPKALIYALKMLQCAEQSKEKTIQSIAYISTAESYEQLYTIKKQPILLDSAFFFAQKAITLSNDFPDQLSNYSCAYSNINMAKLLLNYRYERNPSLQNEINQYLQSGIAYSQKSEDTRLLIADALILKSKLAKKNQNKTDEEKYLLEALDTCIHDEPIDNAYVIDLYKRLANFNKENGRTDRALMYLNEMLTWKDRQFAQIEKNVSTRYETLMQLEQNEQKLKEVEIKSESRRKQNFLLIGLAILLIIGAFYIVKSIKLKLQISLAKQKQLQYEKHEQELQIKFEKEESQRLKTEQELLELQQQKLQTEVLANRLQLQHKNEVLKQIKENIQSEKTVNIDKLLREESMVDKDFESAVFQIEEVHPNFFKSLNDKSLQKLTPLDLKYCAYIYLGMNAKQIGNLLNVEPKSVRMTKYRLKQKIGFATETTLEDFLKTVA